MLKINMGSTWRLAAQDSWQELHERNSVLIRVAFKERCHFPTVDYNRLIMVGTIIIHQTERVDSRDSCIAAGDI